MTEPVSREIRGYFNQFGLGEQKVAIANISYMAADENSIRATDTTSDKREVVNFRILDQIDLETFAAANGFIKFVQPEEGVIFVNPNHVVGVTDILSKKFEPGCVELVMNARMPTIVHVKGTLEEIRALVGKGEPPKYPYKREDEVLSSISAP